MVNAHPPNDSDVHLRILLVEDHPDTADTISVLLRLWGHECLVAPDGPAGLEVAAAYRPDLILLDLGLPGLDGYAVARLLRQRPEGATVPIWVVTGYGSAAYARKAVEVGTDLFLLKPVDPEYLSGLLKQLAAKVLPAGQAHTVGLNGSQPNEQRSTPPFHRNLGTSEPATS